MRLSTPAQPSLPNARIAADRLPTLPASALFRGTPDSHCCRTTPRETDFVRLPPCPERQEGIVGGRCRLCSQPPDARRSLPRSREVRAFRPDLRPPAWPTRPQGWPVRPRRSKGTTRLALGCVQWLCTCLVCMNLGGDWCNPWVSELVAVCDTNSSNSKTWILSETSKKNTIENKARVSGLSRNLFCAGFPSMKPALRHVLRRKISFARRDWTPGGQREQVVGAGRREPKSSYRRREKCRKMFQTEG